MPEIHNPDDFVPSGPFEATAAHGGPAVMPHGARVPAPAGNREKWRLSDQAGKYLGYLGMDGDGWCVLVYDASRAVTLELHMDGGRAYYKNIADGRWLSLNNQAYAGFYSSYNDARSWYGDGTRRIYCSNNGQALSLSPKPERYLCCWNDYPVFRVDQELTDLNIPIQEKIDHIVVVMLENRSFDNVLGWLFEDKGNQPPRNIPKRTPASYDGLQKGVYWNSPDLNNPNSPKIFAQRGASTDPDRTPFPQPGEIFPFMLEQLFGTENPTAEQSANMSGFLQNFGKQEGARNPNQIMECYSPQQLPVISALAQNFAVCDRWFGSVPCQTWPNRAFVHAGSSFGRLNNCNGKYSDDNPSVITPAQPPDPDPEYHDRAELNFFRGRRTVFDVLTEQKISWQIYTSSKTLPGLTRLQFRPWIGGTASIDDFVAGARAGRLPAYCFIEPEFKLGANDQHPGGNCSMRRGEQFLHQIWTAVSTSPVWKRTLLIITYDEHGGCYDHVPPPRTATPPDAKPPQFQSSFNPFTQYGTRVPMLAISAYVEPGTVFRSPSANVEFDHASILATIRDWIFKPGEAAGKWRINSRRVDNAPTIWPVLDRPQPRDDIPRITPPAALVAEMAEAGAPHAIAEDAIPLNHLQFADVLAAEAARQFEHERAMMGANVTERDLIPVYERIEKEVYLYCREHVHTLGDARRLLETPEPIAPWRPAPPRPPGDLRNPD